MLINMKKRQILPLAISSLAMLLASCTGPANNQSNASDGGESSEPASEPADGERKVLEASIKTQ